MEGCNGHLLEKSRKSQRARKSRIILINGQPVLRLNTYTLEEGEPSVFRKACTEEVRPRSEKKRKSSNETNKEGCKKVRHTYENAWACNNKKISEDAIAAKNKAMVFLVGVKETLDPFITPEVKVKLMKAVESLPFKQIVPKTQISRQPKFIVNGEMREYQLEGLSFLMSMFDNGVSMILADEMGLGKTLQTIAFLGYLKFERHVGGPHLVVCPLSVLSSWTKEFERWCPELKVIRLHSSDKAERERFRREVLNDSSSFDVVVTTYEMVASQNMKMALRSKIYWRYLILDEGHKIKNESTLIADAVRHINRQGLLLLTGTPLQNNMHELWALYNQMFPEVFTEPKFFETIYNMSQSKCDFQALDKAHSLYKMFSLRRLKVDVEKSLPPRTELKIYSPLSQMQHFWYRRLLLKNSRLLAQLEAESAGLCKKSKVGDSWKKLQSLLMQLRKCSNHPYMFPGAEGDPSFVGDDIVANSGKMQLLDRLLQKLQKNGHRVVLFSQFTTMLDILEDYCQYRGFDFRRIDGSRSRVQRTIDMHVFNKPSSPVFIFLLATRAGGLGINLQTADTVILFDSDWNPQVDLQAVARVHRIGQTKPVHVYRLLTAGTVEQRIQQRSEKKLFLDHAVNNGGFGLSEENDAKNLYDMLATITFGAKAFISSEDTKELTDEDLDKIIRRTLSGNEETEKQECAKVQQTVPSVMDAFTGTRIFEGVDYTISSNKEISEEWLEKRKRVSTTVEINGYRIRRQNMYSLEEGEPSVFGRECSNTVEDFMCVKRKLQKAGIDYENDDICLLCKDGGLLYCCDMCPAAYHSECLGYTESEAAKLSKMKWGCPHHSCGICGRKAPAVGGLLFRCEMCPNAYCEDDLPPEAELVGNCERFQNLGQQHPTQAYFIHCCSYCTYLSKHQVNGYFEFPAEPTGISVKETPDVNLEIEPLFQTSLPETCKAEEKLQSSILAEIKFECQVGNDDSKTDEQRNQCQNLHELKPVDYASKPSVKEVKGINGTRTLNEVIIID